MKELFFDFYSPIILKSYNLDKTMQYQLNILGSLDPFTRKHCENVANLTCRLCERLHCNRGFTEYCTICAYLHDIGKQFIPPSVLQKPGKLTEEEYAIMKTHTTIGYDICMNDPKLRPYYAGPIYHHEALNGTGYPKGLTKKDIPYEGQIIRVADEFDAIVSKRQYKSHIGISDTLKILIENAHPSKSDAVKVVAENAKLGKNNPIIVKALISVVIEDTEYEIACIREYINNLKDTLKRLQTVRQYEQKMQNAKTERKKQYFLEGMKVLLLEHESIDNYSTILSDYEASQEQKQKQVDKLLGEIKVIKKLKV